MKEYIERSVLIERIEEELSFCEGQDPVVYGCILGLRGALSYAKTLPAADVVERKRGEWVEADDGYGVVCSVCREDFCTIIYETERFNFCPNCGCRMEVDHA